MKRNKKKFILAFGGIVAILALISHICEQDKPNKGTSSPATELAATHAEAPQEDYSDYDAGLDEMPDSIPVPDSISHFEEQALRALGVSGKDSAYLFLPEIHNRHTSVHSYSRCFPDINPVQLKAAMAMGIEPVATREEAQDYVLQHKLVNITNSPYYVVDPLTHSIPYLVPECLDLLNTISLNFIDSLQSKGMPPHIPIVTSVLRTSKDIKKLQAGNVNSTTNSCHCYGTTVDITHNRFFPLRGSYEESQKNISRYNAEMKKILAEVLLDLRMQGRCYVKYEVKQACFHLTIRPTVKNI